MRIKIASNRVYEGTPEEILHRLHRTSTAYKNIGFRSYLEGFIERLRPIPVWLEPPESIVNGTDDAFADWLGSELMRVGRWSETTNPTEEEKEVKAKAVAEAKKKAAEEKAAAAAAKAEAEKKDAGEAG